MRDTAIAWRSLKLAEVTPREANNLLVIKRVVLSLEDDDCEQVLGAIAWYKECYHHETRTNRWKYMAKVIINLHENFYPVGMVIAV